LSRVESFGMATVECVGMGCSAVAWDIDTGTREILSANEAAFVELGDFAGLARAVMAALSIPSRKASAIAERVRRDFGEEAMWRRYSAMISAVLDSPGARRHQAGQVPPRYRPPKRLLQLLPARLRVQLRALIGRSPRLGYMTRELRGR
jgi:hypothetical protein